MDNKDENKIIYEHGADNKVEDVVIGELGESEQPVESGGERHHHHSHHSSHHSSHHHSSHHHSSRHRRRKRRKKESAALKKLKRFIKKHKIVLINIVVTIVAFCLLLALGYFVDKTIEKSKNGNNSDLTNSSINISIPFYTEDVVLTNDAVVNYIDNFGKVTAHDAWKDNGGQTTRLDLAVPLKFYYEISGLPVGFTVDSIVLNVAETADPSRVTPYTLQADENFVELNYLKRSTDYTYTLLITASDGSVVTSSGSFRTADYPQFITVDGVVNVRDIGGWQTSDGRRIRHELLYRGTELDGMVDTYCLTEKGKAQMLEELGIKMDMDLRSTTVNPTGFDALGETVRHDYFPAPQYSQIFEELYIPTVKNIFLELADESNYPIYMHCTYGLDRTGTVCFLLEALLGVPEQELRMDYELSAFAHGYVNLEEFGILIDRISQLEGDTIQEKVEGYLLSIGVTAEEIASIRDILLTDR